MHLQLYTIPPGLTGNAQYGKAWLYAELFDLLIDFFVVWLFQWLDICIIS